MCRWLCDKAGKFMYICADHTCGVLRFRALKLRSGDVVIGCHCGCAIYVCVGEERDT